MKSAPGEYVPAHFFTKAPATRRQDRRVILPTPPRFIGKVAVITGAGTGIGRAAALAFAREGASVVLAGRRIRELEVKGVWLTCKYALEAMRRTDGGGAIVNTSSWLAHGAFPGTSIYSATKAGLDGMIRALALDVGAEAIRVNNVNPGIIDTPMFRRFLPDERCGRCSVRPAHSRSTARP